MYDYLKEVVREEIVAPSQGRVGSRQEGFYGGREAGKLPEV